MANLECFFSVLFLSSIFERNQRTVGKSMTQVIHTLFLRPKAQEGFWLLGFQKGSGYLSSLCLVGSLLVNFYKKRYTFFLLLLILLKYEARVITRRGSFLLQNEAKVIKNAAGIAKRDKGYKKTRQLSQNAAVQKLHTALHMMNNWTVSTIYYFDLRGLGVTWTSHSPK